MKTALIIICCLVISACATDRSHDRPISNPEKFTTEYSDWKIIAEIQFKVIGKYDTVHAKTVLSDKSFQFVPSDIPFTKEVWMKIAMKEKFNKKLDYKNSGSERYVATDEGGNAYIINDLLDINDAGQIKFKMGSVQLR